LVPNRSPSNAPAIGSVISVKHSGFFPNGKIKHVLSWSEPKNSHWTHLDHTKKTDFDPNWSKSGNHKAYFDWLGRELDIHQPSDWYKVKKQDIQIHQGSLLLSKYYKNSVPLAIRTIYPEEDWLPWKFEEKVEPGFWQNQANQKNYLEWFYGEMKFDSLDDWYSISADTISRRGGGGLIDEYKNSLVQVLLLFSFVI
jgi:hypothetical protein